METGIFQTNYRNLKPNQAEALELQLKESLVFQYENSIKDALRDANPAVKLNVINTDNFKVRITKDRGFFSLIQKNEVQSAKKQMEKSKTDQIKQILGGISDEQLTAITDYFTDKNIQGTIDHHNEIIKNTKLDFSDLDFPKDNRSPAEVFQNYFANLRLMKNKEPWIKKTDNKKELVEQIKIKAKEFFNLLATAEKQGLSIDTGSGTYGGWRSDLSFSIEKMKVLTKIHIPTNPEFNAPIIPFHNLRKIHVAHLEHG